LRAALKLDFGRPKTARIVDSSGFYFYWFNRRKGGWDHFFASLKPNVILKNINIPGREKNSLQKKMKFLTSPLFF
jgi:hypothetical protein